MESKDMSGVLFPVENKQSDKHPNLTGNIVINGNNDITDFYFKRQLKETKEWKCSLMVYTKQQLRTQPF